jgi:HD superfamily phosphodiesterase
MYKDEILREMRKIFHEIQYGIDHTLKVLENAEAIMEGEDICAEDREIVSTVAILHDIGAVEALHKYGSLEGTYQEREGPKIAREILDKVGYDIKYVERICYIIGNHHTPSKINGLDFQIQWEADLLENMSVMDIQNEQEKIKICIEDNFKTITGKKMAYNRYIT